MHDIGLSLQRCISLWQIIQILSKHSGFLEPKHHGTFEKKHIPKAIWQRHNFLVIHKLAQFHFDHLWDLNPFFLLPTGSRQEGPCQNVWWVAPTRYPIQLWRASLSLILVELIINWVFPKIWENPQIIHFRVFHYFHHPFWGVKSPYFWKRPFWGRETLKWASIKYIEVWIISGVWMWNQVLFMAQLTNFIILLWLCS